MYVNDDSDDNDISNTQVMSSEQYSTFCSCTVSYFFSFGMYIDLIQYGFSYDL